LRGRNKLSVDYSEQSPARPTAATAASATLPLRIARSKSFPGEGNYYRVENQAPFVLNDLRDGMQLALSKTDEVARNGVLQRITSARGFL
jgi:hypothetical protein